MICLLAEQVLGVGESVRTLPKVEPEVGIEYIRGWGGQERVW